MFPNTETLHIYTGNDIFITGGRISHYVFWNNLSLCEKEMIEKLNNNLNIEFKNVIFKKKDIVEKYIKPNTDFNIIIPHQVRMIDKNVFSINNHFLPQINNIYISDSVKNIHTAVTSPVTVFMMS